MERKDNQVSFALNCDRELDSWHIHEIGQISCITDLSTENKKCLLLKGIQKKEKEKGKCDQLLPTMYPGYVNLFKQ